MHVDSMGVLAARGWLLNDITNIDVYVFCALHVLQVILVTNISNQHVQ